MKALSVIGIILAALGLLIGMGGMTLTETDLVLTQGYGFWVFIISAYLLALAIVATKKR